MSDLIEVTETVFEQYQEIQQSGETNMVKEAVVQRIANDRGLYELVAFIEDGGYYDLLQSYGEYKELYEGK